MSDKGGEDPVVQHATVRYQRDDASVRRILWFGLVLLAFAVIGHGVPAVLYVFFARNEDQRQPPLPPLAAKERLKLPRDLDRLPSPVLRANDTSQLEALRRMEDERLRQYGWIDPAKGVVHLPIEEAMKRLADPKVAEAHGIRVAPQAKGDPR